MASTRRLAAIMFTDIVGYTALAQRDEASALKLLDRHNRLLRPIFPQFHGKEVKAIGDSFLVEFKSALDATNCAIEIQRLLHEDSISAPGESKVRVRIGIHLGDVVHKSGDVFGDSVNIASRMEPLAEPGGICISAQVFDQVRNKIPNSLEKLEPKVLKNVQFPMDIFRIVLPWTVREPPSRDSGPTRLAVLPLANISPDPKDEYFADGLTEELITVLSHLHELRVIARTSVIPYKSSPRPISQIGAELGVSSVLEGSVRKAGDQLRITVQLIDVGSQEHVWADTYDRKLDDVFAIQAEVAKRITDVLRVKLGKSEKARLEEPPPVHPDSYLAYLKGRSLLSSELSERIIRSAKNQFELAVSIDSTNARAYSGLADATTFLGWLGLEASREAWDRARRAYAARAVELDPNLAEAHCTLAMILWDEWDFVGTEKELKHALSLNPSYAEAHRIYSTVFRDEGRPEEALRESELADELDPQSVVYLSDHVAFLCHLRRADAAKPLIERIGKLAPGSAYYHTALAWWQYAQGDFGRSMEECDRAAALQPEDWEGRLPQAWLYALSGAPEKARQILEDAKRMGERARPPWALAVGYAFIGDFDESFRILFKAVEEHNLAFQMIRIDPALEPLRRDARFAQLLKKMNLA